MGDVHPQRSVQTSPPNRTVKFFLVFYLTYEVNPLASRLPTKEKLNSRRPQGRSHCT